MSGTESDSDSQLASSEMGAPHGHGTGGASAYASGSQQPLQSIAERRSGSVDESDEDEDEEGEWRVADKAKQQEEEESVTKSGYLWKKGSRRKVRGCSSAPPRRLTPTGQTLDMEKTLVCAAFAAPGVLQDIGGISTAASTGSQRGALGDAYLAQAAQQHVWTRAADTHVLSAGGDGGAGPRMGAGAQ